MPNLEKELIKVLAKQEGWVSSETLTGYLNISLRTLRSVVKNANENAKAKIVLSSNKGYCLAKSPKILNEVFSRFKKDEVVNLDRKSILLKELLIHKRGVDYFDLADKLAVSEQTILSDAAKLKGELVEYHLSISRKKDSLFLKGNEEEIRRLLSDVVYQEAQDELMSFDALSKFFPAISVEQIRRAVLEEIKKAGLDVVNDYKMMEIILHLCILMNRKEIEEASSPHQSLRQQIPLDAQYHCIIHIIRRIIENTNIVFSEEEINNIHSLLLICTRSSHEKNQRMELERIVKKEIIQFVRKIAQHVYNEFYIDLNNEDFIGSFSLHLSGLTKNKNRKIRNPLLQEIKNVYPVIYEISVFIANMVKEKYPFIIINDDETSYIALHVGAQIENQSSNKIRTVIINPKYLNLNSIILNKIESSFFNDLNILGVVSNQDEMKESNQFEHVDLLISTINISKEKEKETVTVSIFINQDDITNIYNAINKIKSKHSRSNQLSLIHYFDGTFCYLDEKLNNREAVIAKLCNQHKELDSSFYQRVLMREEISSTEYLNMAITHPIECSEKQTFITVGVFKKPFRWNVNEIDIVFLLSVSRQDRESFLKILAELIKIFSSVEWKEVWPTIQSYTQFIEFLENQQLRRTGKYLSMEQE